MADNIMEFGFDDAKVIKNQGVEQFKQGKKGEKTRVSIISFKKFHDVVLASKQREKVGPDGKMIPLTDAEKSEYIQKIDAKLAQQLGKSVDQLTDVDRLDIKQPRFKFGFTHFGEGVGTIRCLGKYEGSQLVKPEICCDKFGDAEQTVGAVIMTYPVDDDLNVDDDLLKAKKYTNFYIWKMGSKKFKKLETAYAGARSDGRFVLDLSVQLDGDPKYQGQVITAHATAFWAREGADPAVRAWVLDQGLRAWKHVDGNLGFEMAKDKLLEKLGVGSGSSTHGAIGSGNSSDQPKLISDYGTLLD
jgi:hypothetical protein